MINYKNLSIIGTSHIAAESVIEVGTFILKERPAIVALELDKRRAYSMLNAEKKLSIKDIKHLGIRIFILNLIGSWVEKKLGERVGIKPGSEMKRAVECARTADSKVILIDQDIKITLRNLVKTPVLEVIKVIFDSIFGFIFRKDAVRIDLTKVPKKVLINKILKLVKKRYPYIHKVLIDDRNKIMAKRIIKIMEIYEKEKILAVVGAGHEDEIAKMVKNEI
ncbi:TraB/GumN family protein [Candidatus Woesearchaeota archaeon]|nr:TraB/GumN family protein [Candidatus Woesearchaeota archaeon]